MAKTAEYGLGPSTFARGWYMIADASAVRDRPLALRYFGHDFVLYRGKDSGKVALLDAYCPHMKTHLARNETSHVVRGDKHVDGDLITCPYHGWQFGLDGRCVHIPYSDFISPAAKIKSWPVVERAGVIWMWYDEEGGEADYLLSDFPELSDPTFVKWRIDDMGTMASHPIEIVDNMADWAHNLTIHGAVNVSYFANEFRDHIVVQRFYTGHNGLARKPGDAIQAVSWMTGPAMMHGRISGHMAARFLICFTPIEDGHIQMWHALSVQAPNTPPTQADLDAIEAYAVSGLGVLKQDFDVWANKEPAIQPLQNPKDRPFGRLRIWYQQFYNSREAATAIHRRVNGTVVTIDNLLPEFEIEAVAEVDGIQ